MITLARITKMGLVFTLSMGLFVFACHAETLAVYSEQYMADLEQKQMLLESVREDSYQTESDIKDIGDKVKAIQKNKVSHLGAESVTLGQIMPPTEKIVLAFPYMSGTLSPRAGARSSEQNSNKSRQ